MGLLTNEIKSLIEQQKLGYVATVSPDNTPNLSPKGTISVWDDEHLVFADIKSPKTMANLEKIHHWKLMSLIQLLEKVIDSKELELFYRLDKNMIKLFLTIVILE